MSIEWFIVLGIFLGGVVVAHFTSGRAMKILEGRDPRDRQ
jgi:hypothetical protein